jgi:thiol:disulfide interchange protein DsbD
LGGNSNLKNKVSWTTTLSKSNVHVGDTLAIVFKGTIEKDWNMYASNFDENVGPVVANIQIEKEEGFRLLGALKSIQPREKYDYIFEGKVTYFLQEAHFEQKVILTNQTPHLSGVLVYQVCNDNLGQCKTFDESFEFTPKVLPARASKVTKTALSNQPAPNTSQTNLDTMAQDMSDNATNLLNNQNENKKTLTLKEREDHNKKGGLWWFVFISFVAGLVSVITPCVFPMVPMTVSYFTHGAHDHKGIGRPLLYGFSIIFIYTFFGILLAKINGPEFANFLSTHWIPNILFTIIFILFALSFFGWFEITLPNSWVNKVDRASDKGGLLGIFFMAFTIVLVSFSCTGPIVSTILLEAAGGEFIKPIAGMLAYSFAFAFPFTFFAMFPKLLKNIPKSGSWLNTVKVSLGFIELALSLKFLSMVDQVLHWGILDREIFLALWIVIFLCLTLYLLGIIKLSDYDKGVISVGRLLVAMSIFVFVVYMIPGLWGAPLKALSGYLPPLSTQDFIIGQTQETNQKNPSTAELCNTPKYSDLLKFPYGFNGYFDYKEALECAKKQNKPLFIDFTGHGCTNCRKVESDIWPNPNVKKLLNDSYVMVALYVDDRTELPESQWYTSTYDQKVKKTIGKQNADFEITRFNYNAQPFYVLIDPYTEQLLAQPIGYVTDATLFEDFLKEGISNFKLLNQK